MRVIKSDQRHAVGPQERKARDQVDSLYVGAGKFNRNGDVSNGTQLFSSACIIPCLSTGSFFGPYLSLSHNGLLIIYWTDTDRGIGSATLLI